MLAAGTRVGAAKHIPMRDVPRAITPTIGLPARSNGRALLLAYFPLHQRIRTLDRRHKFARDLSLF